MIKKNATYLLLLTVVLLATTDYSSAKTTEVSDAEGLISQLPMLQNGDTLQLTASHFTITADLAPEGLIIASSEWSPFKNVTIMGEGMDRTVIDFSDSYGFFSYYSSNLLIKDLTIKNAAINGGVYMQSSSVNLEGVKITNCKNVVSGTKTEAHGGALFYDANSTFTSIKNCIFSGNYAQDNGGAIAFMNRASLYPQKSYIEDCQFYNNASKVGAALYLDRIYSYFYVYRNVFFANDTTPAIYVNAVNHRYARLYLNNNTVALNAQGGLLVGSGLRSYLFLNNNVIANNGVFDIKRSHSTTQYSGNYNVAGVLTTNAFSGRFNEVMTHSIPLFVVENDSLKHSKHAADYLLGRVPASAKFDNDMYGNACLSPADIGAINVPQGHEIAVWTGDESQDFFQISNWRNGILPQGMGVPSAAKKIIISQCTLDNYPIIPDVITVANGGDFSQSDIRITPTGLLENKGDVSVDTLYVESHSDGVGQWLNNGVIAANERLAEFIFEGGKWSLVYISNSTLRADQLFPNGIYQIDYHVEKYLEQAHQFQPVLAGELFDPNQAYAVLNTTNQKVVLTMADDVHDQFLIQHTQQLDSLSSGFNLIGNPYGVALQAGDILQNAGNEIAAAGAIYTYDGARYKTWVDGVGDEEAQLIQPRQAFFVQALDQVLGLVDQTTFTVDQANRRLLDYTNLTSTAVQREGVLTVGIATSDNTIYDRTYLRFKGTASPQFDFNYDALKMERLEDVKSSFIYTTNGANDAARYAVNTQPLAAETRLSIPLRLDFVPSTISSSQSRKLVFSMAEGESLSYLLHDALKDSSESVALTNNTTVALVTGTDSAALSKRFSLQIFDGEVPELVLGTATRQRPSVFDSTSVQNDTLFTGETIHYTKSEVPHVMNKDTTLLIRAMVDTIKFTSISVTTQVDSIFNDTTFMDTTRLWGSYHYVETDTLVESFTVSVSETNTKDTLGQRWYAYTDTVLVTSLLTPKRTENIDIYAFDRTIYISSYEKTKVRVKVFNLSGQQIIQTLLPLGKGTVPLETKGFFIVSAEQNGIVVSRQVIIE